MARLHPTMIAAAALLAAGLAAGLARGEPLAARPAPQFTQSGASAWLNSAPLTMRELRGKVLLLDVWTFACWNCYRSFPWLLSVEKAYRGAGLQIVGIHSPELPMEHDRAQLIRKVHTYGLDHPIMIDDDFRYFRALGNDAWPAFYLVDKRGRLRYRFYGETHAGDAQAREIASAIGALLREP